MNEPGLTKISRELVEMLRRAPADGRRQMVERACVLAVERSGLTDPSIADAVDVLRRSEFSTPSFRSQVDILTQQLDEIAWDLQQRIEEDGATEADYEEAFAKARASAAIGFALEDSLDAAFDALYEAYYAINDRDDFMRSLTD